MIAINFLPLESSTLVQFSSLTISTLRFLRTARGSKTISSTTVSFCSFSIRHKTIKIRTIAIKRTVDIHLNNMTWKNYVLIIWSKMLQYFTNMRSQLEFRIFFIFFLKKTTTQIQAAASYRWNTSFTYTTLGVKAILLMTIYFVFEPFFKNSCSNYWHNPK